MELFTEPDMTKGNGVNHGECHGVGHGVHHGVGQAAGHGIVHEIRPWSRGSSLLVITLIVVVSTIFNV